MCALACDAEATGTEVDNGYICFSISLLLFPEMINIYLRRQGVES